MVAKWGELFDLRMAPFMEVLAKDGNTPYVAYSRLMMQDQFLGANLWLLTQG
jgi:hypothetical protein